MVGRVAPACVVLLPLVHWTDEDVWGYLVESGAPFERSRYVQSDRGTWIDDVSSHAHSEYLPVCHECVGSAGEVRCPAKGGSQVPGILPTVQRLMYPAVSTNESFTVVAL